VLGQLERVFRRGTLAGLSEASLLERYALRRDEAAFAALVARHGPMVLGVCRRVLRDEHDVEDAFQATFLVFVRRAGAIRDGDLVGHWLYGVAHRVAVRARANAAKRHAHEPLAPEAIDSAIVEPGDDVGELRAVVDEELARLPGSLRAPLVLCYLEGLTHDEAASRLRWPVGTVRSRMARGRDVLRRRLARRGFAPEGSAQTAALAPEPVAPGLLDLTVKASLDFAARNTAATAVTSATAAALAKGVIDAMTIAKLKVLGAATLACLVALGGVQTFAQFGGFGFGPPTPKAKGADRPSAVVGRLGGLQEQVRQVKDQLAGIEAEIQAIREEVEARPKGDAPAKPAGGADVVDPTSTVAPPAPAKPAANRPDVPLTYRIDFYGLLIVVSPEGDRVAAYTGPGRARNPIEPKEPGYLVSPVGTTKTLKLFETKEPRHSVSPVETNGLVALSVVGPKITRIAVYSLNDGNWHPIDLREPVESATPNVFFNAAVYVLGRRLYGFSAVPGQKGQNRWDVLELPDVESPMKVYTARNTLVCEHDGHIYTFNPIQGHWQDLDTRAILDAADDEGEAKAKK
jgi:RNA polymerase sigma factor (sigma-70 family)